LVVLVRLSVPVQVIDWKDSSPKWHTMCWWGRQTLLTLTCEHSAACNRTFARLQGSDIFGNRASQFLLLLNLFIVWTVEHILQKILKRYQIVFLCFVEGYTPSHIRTIADYGVIN